MTEVSLKEYVDCAIRSERALRETQHNEVAKALEVAREGMEKRLDAMNEFREALKDQTMRAVGRSEYELAHNVLAEKIRTLELESTKREVSARNVAIISSIVASLLVGIVSTIASHWLMKP